MFWLNIDNTNPAALAGLSDGSGRPSEFTISDLSNYARDMDEDGLVDSWEVDHRHRRSELRRADPTLDRRGRTDLLTGFHPFRPILLPKVGKGS